MRIRYRVRERADDARRPRPGHAPHSNHLAVHLPSGPVGCAVLPRSSAATAMISALGGETAYAEGANFRSTQTNFDGLRRVRTGEQLFATSSWPRDVYAGWIYPARCHLRCRRRRCAGRAPNASVGSHLACSPLSAKFGKKWGGSRASPTFTFFATLVPRARPTPATQGSPISSRPEYVHRVYLGPLP